MAEHYTRLEIIRALCDASAYLSSRKEEINRLNVFPVPDGDTGTNMSLTLESVIENIKRLGAAPSTEEIRKAVTNGALMGARGNSGVITSQILRGFCEGNALCDELDTAGIDVALQKANEVARKAVRKPVEGTILTVLNDTAQAAKTARKKKMSTDEALEFISSESYKSVERTPDLLPVLKENGVVDAGGFGLAIMIDGFVSSLLGKESQSGYDFQIINAAAPKVEIEQINDWEGSRFRYCNEFLVDSETLDKDEALNFLSTMGDCELCVGSTPKFKVHVHSNTPDKVLAYFLERGQISEVFIHNMQLQAGERNEKLTQEAAEMPHKNIGIVAVCAGSGTAEILKSLGVDIIVSGGQTMNPSTKDILDAVSKLNADAAIVFPNNSNIIMAAQSAANISEIPCSVVPTKSVPQCFVAMFETNQEASLKENVEVMTEAFAGVKTGEITQAIKNSKDAHDNPIAEGDFIGIFDGSIEAIGQSNEEVMMALLEVMEADDADTLTILAGEDYSDEQLNALVERVQEAYEDLEIDPQRGEQPLYPIVFSLE